MTTHSRFFPHFPLPPICDERDCYACNFLNFPIPKYTETAIERVKNLPEIKIGECFDIISLLSDSHLMQLKTRKLKRGQPKPELFLRGKKPGQLKPEVLLRGKYILVCCFMAPLLSNSGYACFARGLSAVCSQLYSERDDFELVVVVKMNRGWENEQDFIHFLSGFPSSCLAVHFSDLSCDLICKSINLDSVEPKYFLVDSAQKVVQHSGNKHVFSLLLYGADVFPFSDTDLSEPTEPWETPCRLEKLLGLKDSDSLFKFPQVGLIRDCHISVRDLKEKVVGVYICVSGSLIEYLHDLLYQNGQPRSFEVVLVYWPLDIRDLGELSNNVEIELRKLKISWWVLPYKDSVSRRLWRWFQFQGCGGVCDDGLIIVGRRGKYVDPFGASVIKRSYEMSMGSYSFTRAQFIKSAVERFEKLLNLEAFLMVYKELESVADPRRVAVDKLMGKNVLVYFDEYNTTVEEFGRLLLGWYGKSDFEVVFMYRDYEEFSWMPWPVCPLDDDHLRHLSERIPSQGEAIIIAFGANGRISSSIPRDLPDGAPKCLYKDTLRQQVISWLKAEFFCCVDGIE